MRKRLKLEDTYRFPGFRPAATVHGIFGDQKARTVTLKRTGTKMICGGCGAVNHATYDSKVRRVRDLPCGDMRVYLEVIGASAQGKNVSLKNGKDTVKFVGPWR